MRKVTANDLLIDVSASGRLTRVFIRIGLTCRSLPESGKLKRRASNDQKD